MLKRLIIISGPEKSGKMPLARDLMAKDPSLVLVHRDFLRTSFETEIDEGDITLLMADLVRGILRLGRSPIVVAWNLEPFDHCLWHDIGASTKTPVEWLDVREKRVEEMIPKIEGMP